MRNQEETTYWSYKGIIYRLRDNAIPEIWNTNEEGWQLTQTLMKLIVGGDPTIDLITADDVERVFPGATVEDAAIISTP